MMKMTPPGTDSPEGKKKRSLRLHLLPHIIIFAVLILFIYLFFFNSNNRNSDNEIPPKNLDKDNSLVDIYSQNPTIRKNGIQALLKKNDFESVKLVVSSLKENEINTPISDFILLNLQQITNEDGINWLCSDGLEFQNNAVKYLSLKFAQLKKQPKSIPYIINLISSKSLILNSLALETIKLYPAQILKENKTSQSIYVLLLKSKQRKQLELIKCLLYISESEYIKKVIEFGAELPNYKVTFKTIINGVSELLPNQPTIEKFLLNNLSSPDHKLREISSSIISITPKEKYLSTLSSSLNDKAEISLKNKLYTLGHIYSINSYKLLEDFIINQHKDLSNDLLFFATYNLLNINPVVKNQELKKILTQSDWRIKNLLMMKQNEGKSSPSKKLIPIFKFRAPSLKQQKIKEAWGEGMAWKSISNGIDWLMLNQSDDGRWDCSKLNPYNRHILLPDFTLEDEVFDPAVTSLGIFCFLNEGSTHLTGKYKTIIKNALDFVLSCQDETGLINIEKGHKHTPGCLAMGEDHGPVVRRYNHSISLLMLTELYLMTEDKAIGKAVQSAFNECLFQREEEYGWSWYLEPTDIGPSYYYIMALYLSQFTDLNINPKEILWAKKYLEQITDRKTGRILYLCDIPWCFGGYDSSATGLFLRTLFGYSQNVPAQQNISQLLSKHKPSWNTFYTIPNDANDITLVNEDIVNFWQWLYQTYALINFNNKELKEEWLSEIQSVLIQNVRNDGAFKGSWDPEGAWSSGGGRAYSTIFSILILQAPYSYNLEVRNEK